MQINLTCLFLIAFAMSWFDTTGIASFAKSALTTAQKTIDKALDIQEEKEIARENTPKLLGLFFYFS